MMAHMVPFQCLENSTAHRPVMRGVVGDIVYQIANDKPRKDYCRHERRLQEYSKQDLV